MWLLQIIWFVILCVIGYSWFGGWGVVLVILATIHFRDPVIEYVEVEKAPLLKDQYDPDYDGSYPYR